MRFLQIYWRRLQGLPMVLRRLCERRFFMEEVMEEYKKVTISFTKDQLKKLDEIMSKEQGYSRSSLVREAVDNYIGYRAQKENISYLSPIISQNIKLVLSRFEENLSEMLFKLAVEVSKSNILSARNSDLNDYALNYLNAVSEQLVAEHNGVLDLEKARDFIDGEENG